MLNKGVTGQPYCIGGNNQQPNLRIVEFICDLVDDRLGRPRGVARALIRHVEDRPGHDRRYAINADKMRRELGWTPRFEFATALSKVVDWYLAHGEWVDAIRGEYLRLGDLSIGSNQ